MTADWDTYQAWRKQIERRLFELGALVKGNLPIQADRVNDCVEQIDELRQELKAVSERIEKMATWIKANVPKKNGGDK
jgi:cytochrome c556